MNNIVLIRGDKIAFSYFPGCYGDGGHVAHDLADLVTPMGLFIPVHDSGTQLMSHFDPEAAFNPLAHKSFGVVAGDKGVLVAPEMGASCKWHMVKMTEKKSVKTAEMLTGKNGHAIISIYDHLRDTMAMCVRLTSTIEESVQMYSRHTFCDIKKVVIWDRKKCFQFMKENFKTKYKKRIESLTT